MIEFYNFNLQLLFILYYLIGILHRPKRKMRQNKWLKENTIIHINGEEPIFITKPFLALGVIFLVV